VAAESYPGVTRIREDWENVLGYLAEQDVIVVLDEFPYLVEQDESLPSVLQAISTTTSTTPPRRSSSSGRRSA
jgi:hypothetical protein